MTKKIEKVRALVTLAKVLLISLILLATVFVLLHFYYGSPTAFNTRITHVEYAQQYGPSLRTYFPSSGHILLLVGIFSEGSQSLSYGYPSADLALVDSEGNTYPLVSEYNGRYIFDVPTTVSNLRLRLPGGSMLKVKLP